MIDWKKVAKILWKRLHVQNNVHNVEVVHQLEMLKLASLLERCHCCRVRYATQVCGHNVLLCDVCAECDDRYHDELAEVAQIRDINIELDVYDTLEGEQRD
jgi:hypothetical protein